MVGNVWGTYTHTMRMVVDSVGSGIDGGRINDNYNDNDYNDSVSNNGVDDVIGVIGHEVGD